MLTPAATERPSERVAELIREGVERLLSAPEEVYARVDAVILADADSAVTADPALVAAIRRTNRANLIHWAEANFRDPGAPVAPNLGPETLGIARDLVRRGLNDSSLDAYRIGQNAAWRIWMNMAFELTSDTAELSELLDVTARSVFAFVDATLAGIRAQIALEYENLTRGTHVERLEVVTLILEGAPIRADHAGSRLRYRLDRSHTAAIVFSDAPAPDHGVLEAAAEAVARAAGAPRAFSVVASASTLWAWVPGVAGPDPEAVTAALETLPEVRVALGSTGHGIEGFRRSHLDALAVQRLLHRTRAEVRLAGYDEVRVVALITQDEEGARDLVESTLGALATAPPELAETLRIYLREESSATRAAAALFTHRNTVLNRLARARELLPAPLEGRALQVGLALEVARWLGPR